MKQYVKNKTQKVDLKFWYRCASKTGYFYQFDLYLEKKENVEETLEGSLVLTLT